MNKDGMPTGALPPLTHAWQVGKTAASVDFVVSAERHLLTHPEDEVKLRSKIDDIKSGKLVLTDWLGVKDALRDS